MNELTIGKTELSEIEQIMPEHAFMLREIETAMPEIVRASSLFGKHQSQFMDNMFTVNHLTPIRNLRQMLAEIEQIRMALKENFFKLKKKKIRIKQKLREIASTEDELKKEYLLCQIDEFKSQSEDTQKYISGAIRKLANYQEQYNSVLKSFNVENFNEIDFEVEEEKYHIMKAFEQGLTAARSRQGLIDEGNLIYLSQLGINGGVAQQLVVNYLNREAKLMQEDQEPTYELQLEFLEAMAFKFKGCARKLAVFKGQTGTVTEFAALKTGDTRLLGGSNES